MSELETLRELLDSAPDAMVVVDRDSRIALVNRQTEVMFGYARAELLGQPLALLIPERFRARHAEHVARYHEHPTTRPMGTALQLRGRRRDGSELPIEVSLSPQHGTTVSAAIRDVSDRVRIEAELREARAAAEAASAAKSEFLSSMSHELRTPLNAVLGFAQLLEHDRKEPLSERHRQRVAHILRGGEHLLRLIDEILDLARIEAGRVSLSLEVVDVVGVLAEVKRTLEPIAARQGVALHVEAPAVLRAIADRTRLAQVLMNFGSNAIKYNREGGRATFRVEGARISVIDTGLGVPLAQQDKLFQAFQRAGQEAGPIEGTGIGLFLSKRLAELMNAIVGFASGADGSTFWIELPLATEARTLVLYVEDNPANVAFMEDLAGSIDVELVVAPTAEAGIDIARARRPDAILMDINLPGMSGLEALRVLRADPETARIPVIALTAAASERDRERGLAAGFDRYLTKPVNVPALVEVLQTVGEKRPAPPA